MMLELKNVSIECDGKMACQDLSFMLSKGKTVCVCAQESGEASPVLSAILGFRPVKSGYITIGGERLTPLSAGYFRQQMAYIAHDMAFYEGFVKDVLRSVYAFKTARDSKFNRSETLSEWQLLGLDEALLEAKAEELTATEWQKIMLSVACLWHRPIVLIDNLHGMGDLKVMDYLFRMARSGQSLLLSTPETSLASYFDETYYLYNPKE